MLGKTQPVILQMLKFRRESAEGAEGRDDGARRLRLPLLHGMVPTADPMVAFKDVEVALLVGARPPRSGHGTQGLLEANGRIFAPQGKALSAVASRKVKVLCGRHPATPIAHRHEECAGLKAAQFTAMMAWTTIAPSPDRAENRQAPELRSAKSPSGEKPLATQYPDVFQAECGGKKVWPMINDPKCSKRIPSRRSRSAAPRSSRPADCPPRERGESPPWTTCRTGSRQACGQLGQAWRPLDGSYGIAEA